MNNYIVFDFSSTERDCMKLYIPFVHNYNLLTLFNIEGFSFEIKVESFFLNPLVIVIK